MGTRVDHFNPSLESLQLGRSGRADVVLQWAADALAVLIFLLISLGGLVRNEGAGLSCPDWPLCFGKVVPPMDYQIFLEWFHRLMAGSVSTLLIGISAFVFTRPEWRSRLGRLCVTAIALLLSQIVLGGMTVLGLLSPKWVSSHLAVAMAFFGAVLWINLSVREMRGLGRREIWRRGAAAGWVVTGILYAQILMGGLVSSNYAGLACPDFPTCGGLWVPELVGPVALQFAHRVGAVVATLAIVLFVASRLRSAPSTRARRALLVLPGLLALQICLGVGNVVFQLPLLMSVAHLATAAAMLGALLVTVYEYRRG